MVSEAPAPPTRAVVQARNRALPRAVRGASGWGREGGSVKRPTCRRWDGSVRGRRTKSESLSAGGGEGVFTEMPASRRNKWEGNAILTDVFRIQGRICL